MSTIFCMTLLCSYLIKTNQNITINSTDKTLGNLNSLVIKSKNSFDKNTYNNGNEYILVDFDTEETKEFIQIAKFFSKAKIPENIKPVLTVYGEIIIVTFPYIPLIEHPDGSITINPDYYDKIFINYNTKTVLGSMMSP